MRIHVAYRTNTAVYDDDVELFHADYVYDLSALRLFVVAPDSVHGNHYSNGEARRLIDVADGGHRSDYFEAHDKYTFYDTDWEREQVLSDDQDIETADIQVTVYLNS